MPNIPKPELERGNYLVYTNEPDTVIDSAGGGGGGGGDEAAYDVTFVVFPDEEIIEYQTTPFFKIDGVEISGFENMSLDEQFIYTKTYSVKSGSLITTTNVTGFSPFGDLYGCFECKLVGSADMNDATPLAITLPESLAAYFADNYSIDENIPPETIAIVRTMFKESQ